MPVQHLRQPTPAAERADQDGAVGVRCLVQRVPNAERVDEVELLDRLGHVEPEATERLVSGWVAAGQVEPDVAWFNPYGAPSKRLSGNKGCSSVAEGIERRSIHRAAV